MADKEKATLIKVLPIKRKISPNSDIEYDSLLLWYRDEKGAKHTRYVDRAQVPYYIIKDKTSQEAITPPMFIEKDKVDKVITYSDMLYREIAMRTDSLSYYDRVTLTWGSKSSNMKNLLKHNWIYNSDMDVSDRYIKNFNEEFDPDPNYKLYKCYYDIEVDLMPNGFVKDAKGNIGYMGFPEEDIAPCPVNIITLIDATTNVVYSFVCRNPLNTSQKEFEATLNNTMIDEIKNTILERNGVVINNVCINFYNSEEETIEAFFAKVHDIDPDIMLAWNAGFDCITLMNRLTKLYSRKKELKDQGIRGYDQMLSTVCDRKYTLVQNEKGEDIYLTPRAKYKQHPEQNYVDRMDEFTILDGIIWIDQMLLYANVRKSTMKESYSLDSIANEELGSEKLDYSGYTIKNLPWKNFYLFTKYNIFDCILLKCIEDKNLDIDMLQRLSEITNTRKYKVFKKTISIKNFVNKFAEVQGFVMGNNKNAQYGDDSAYFEKEFLNKKEIVESDERYLDAFNKKENFGAFVGDPNQNAYEGIKDASGKRSMFIYENVFDEDFSALYPSIIRAYNLDKNTQIGKFFLLDNHIKQKLIEDFGYDGLFAVSKNEEAAGTDSSADIGTTLVDSLTSHNWSRIGEKYFDLPSTTDMINELKELHK